jgi:hypothetical protein
MYVYSARKPTFQPDSFEEVRTQVDEQPICDYALPALEIQALRYPFLVESVPCPNPLFPSISLRFAQGCLIRE